MSVYCTNLRNSEMTEYTGFAFLSVVRFGDHHYGVAADGLYQLGGDKDSVASIDCYALLNNFDMGAPVRKRVTHLTIDGDDLDVTTYVDEVENGTYRGVRRATLARGPEGRHWAFKIANVTGKMLAFSNVKVNVEPIRRP